MYLRRLWNSWTPLELRQAHPLTLALLLVGFVALTLLLLFGLHPSFSTTSGICFYEQSLQRISLLNASARVRIIPSSPQRKFSQRQKGERNRIEEKEDGLNNPCISIPTPPFKSSKDAVIICIHDPEQDQTISGYLKRHAAWERKNVQELYKAHSINSDLMLVDLGCNLGVFTLPAARMGMQVLALDAMTSSLRLLQRSLLINGLSCNVTLVHNALYRRRMRMRVALDPSNVGASRVVEIMASRKDKVPQKDLVDAICLDDLVPLVKGRDVFLKMDLEASEDAVLECAHRFFTEVNVKVLLLEWLWFRHQEEKARAIMDFLFQHDMRPTWGLDSDREIDIHAAHSWPENVFWLKNG